MWTFVFLLLILDSVKCTVYMYRTPGPRVLCKNPRWRGSCTSPVCLLNEPQPQPHTRACPGDAPLHKHPRSNLGFCTSYCIFISFFPSSRCWDWPQLRSRWCGAATIEAEPLGASSSSRFSGTRGSAEDTGNAHQLNWRHVWPPVQQPQLVRRAGGSLGLPVKLWKAAALRGLP